MNFRYFFASIAITFGCLSPEIGVAATTKCPDNFLDGQAPDLTNPKLGNRSTPLCYSEFGVLYSALTRTPLWSADHLSDVTVEEARKLRRTDATESFHAEYRIPEGDRSELSDYRKSGYDRGHMSPNGDFDSPQSQGESFTLANMVPQWPSQNRGIWESIEEATRGLAVNYGEAYVVTVPIFAGAQTLWLQNRVAIPVKIAKAVYLPSVNVASVYISDNDDEQNWKIISVSELRDLSGIDVFPALAESIKAQVVQFPPPSHRRRYAN